VSARVRPAGTDVLLPDPEEQKRRNTANCATAGLVGLHPLDKPIDDGRSGDARNRHRRMMPWLRLRP